MLADLSLGGGAILSAPEDTIYVFDEGHHLGSKTTGHFSYRLRIKSSQRWLAKATRSLNKLLNDTSEHMVLRGYVETRSDRRSIKRGDGWRVSGY